MTAIKQLYDNILRFLRRAYNWYLNPFKADIKSRIMQDDNGTDSEEV